MPSSFPFCDEAYSGFITGVSIPVDGGFSAYSGCINYKIIVGAAISRPFSL